MKIALVCFAFLPNSGSEPGVGWKWATAMKSLGWDVTVFVRRQHYEMALNDAIVNNVKLVPVGVSRIETAVMRRPFLLYAYLYVWQAMAALAVWQFHRTTPFAVTHHLTYGGIRIPSFLGLIKCRTIYGPLGGGEMAPWPLIRALGWRSTIKEFVRYVSNITTKVNPVLRIGYCTSDRILLKTNENLRFIPRSARSRAACLREIGVSDILEVRRVDGGRGRLLFVARSLYWKGGRLAIEAFSIALGKVDATLTIVGTGSERYKWEQIASRLGCADKINWIDRVDQALMPDLYREHDVFLFPSLHDSSGNVVLEAMAHGLPVVCLNLGGPGEMNLMAGGKTIDAGNTSFGVVVEKLADAVVELVQQPEIYRTAVDSAYRFLHQETWKSRVLAAYEPFTALQASVE